MKKRVLGLMSGLVLLGAVVPSVQAMFDSVGLSARAAGLGNAFVAASGHYGSAYWNPAGISLLKRRALHSEYRNPYGLGILRYFGTGYVQPNLGKGAVGFTWYRLETAGNASFLDYSENTIGISYGTKVFSPLLLGTTIKYYRVHSTIGASGIGIDAGLSYFLKKPEITFGASAQDMSRTLITWETGAKEHLPVIVRAGAAYRIFIRSLLLAQVQWKELKNRSHHFGLEQTLYAHILTLRAGGNEAGGIWRFSWGIGLTMKQLNFDYGWERRDRLGDTQIFSVSWDF